jgi:hypothetical protein
MRSLRPPAIIAALLIIATSIQPAPLSQPAPKPSQPKQPASRQRQTKRPRRADALTTAIKELLKANPLAPKSPDEKASKENTSEDADKLPADDAPIKKLIAYWREHGNDAGVNAPKPSDRVRQRLLEACEDSPNLFYGLVDCLPENADTHDRLYKLLNEEPEGEEAWQPDLRTWLRRNSAYFRDELIKAASAADDNVYEANEELRALARLDWNAARPIMEKLASARKAFVTPVALALLYEHAAQEGDSARAESFRALLKAIVENREASWSASGDEYRRGGAKAVPEWREFSSGKPGEVKDEPSAYHILKTPSSAPKTATAIRPGPFGQPAAIIVTCSIPRPETFNRRRGNSAR